MKRLLCVLVCLSGLSVATMAQGKTLKQMHIVFVTGDHEYSSETTMPLLAKVLEERYGARTTVLKSVPDENGEEDIPGLAALDSADLAILFLRWRRLPPEQIAHIERYLKSGKPLIAFRTSTHSFNYPKGHPLESWNRYAATYLGAPPGWGSGHYHYGHLSTTAVSVIGANAKHSILTGVPANFAAPSWLYHILPNYPPQDATLLLMGKAINAERAATRPPVDNPVAWTWTNAAKARVFVTTLGHPDDFKLEAMQRLVVNAIHWAVQRPVPKRWAGVYAVDVKYHGIRPTR